MENAPANIKRGNIPFAAVGLLHKVSRFRIRINIDLIKRHAAHTQELLGAPAIVAP